MAGFSRRAFLGAVASSGALACGGVAEGSAPPHERGSVDFSIDLQRSGLRLAVPGFEGEVRVCLVADSHLALRDARDAAHRDFCSRMAQWPGSPKAFSAILARARKGKSDLMALVGDIIGQGGLQAGFRRGDAGDGNDVGGCGIWHGDDWRKPDHRERRGTFVQLHRQNDYADPCACIGKDRDGGGHGQGEGVKI